MHWLRRNRLLILAAICIFWTVALLLGRLLSSTPFLSAPWRTEQGFEDLLRREGQKTPTRKDFVLLGIDQATLQMPPLLPEEVTHNRAFQLMTEKPFPWSREVWAVLMDKLFASGARLVMFDLVFSPPNEGDAAFKAALDKYRGRVVIGANVDTAGMRQIIWPNEDLIPPPANADRRVGYVNFWPDPIDGKVRAANFTTTERQLAGMAPYPGAEVFESFAARGLEQLGRGADVPLDQRSHMIRFSQVNAYPARTLYEVFDPKLWHANYHDGAFFKGKIVLIGATSQIAHDVVDTPLGPNTLGPELHLQTMAAALAHQFLTPTPPRMMFALVGAAGLLAWLLIAFVRRPLLCLVTLVLASSAYLLASRVLYDRTGFILLTVPVLSAFLLSGLFSLGFEYALERIEKLRTRRTLERYVSRNLVKEILDNPGGYYNSMRGSRRPVTVLFSDLIGFTTLSEKADPEELVRQLNEYLSRMVGVVFDNDGTLDKFIGDAIMAVWGNVKSLGVAEDAKACARAALGMRRELKKLNDGWRAQNRLTLGMGVGINQGEVIIGNIGSYEPNERLDPTVIGDSVNLASRLEGLTRIYGVDILVGPTAGDLIRDDFHLRSVAHAQVKGKTKPVEVYTLVGARTDGVSAEELKCLEIYEKGIARFRGREFTQAKQFFGEFLEKYPNDSLATLYLDRAGDYEAEPPPDDWNAVEVFKKK